MRRPDEQGASPDPSAYAALTVTSPAIKTPYDARHFGFPRRDGNAAEQFGVVNLEAFGCAHLPLAVRAAGAIVRYLAETNAMLLPLLTGLRTYHTRARCISMPPPAIISNCTARGGRGHRVVRS